MKVWVSGNRRGHRFAPGLLLALLPFALGAATAAEPAPVAMPAKGHLHVYLLLGQSNMAGRGLLNETNRLPSDRVLKFTAENRWAPAVEPLHFDKPAIAGAGLGMSFARAMADADPAITIGLVPCAVGGTPLDRWMKGADLYEAALVRARAALKDGTLKGILWHQGEGDSGTEEKARSYAARLSRMVGDLRTDLGAGDVPFLAGQLGKFPPKESKSGKPSLRPVVNEQIASIGTLIPRAAAVDSAGLGDKGDGTHFDTPALREFGLRYAKAMQALQGKGSP